MATAPRRDEPNLFLATAALVVLLPMPLGAIYQWSWGLMVLVMGVVLAFWSVRVALGQQEAAVGLRGVWWLWLPFAACILWIALQTSAWTPGRWHHPLWESTADALQLDLGGAISLNPFRGISGLARLLAYGGVFWIALQYCRRAVRARQVLTTVTYAGAAYALYGLLVYLTGADFLLFFHRPPNPGDLTSSFVSRNSYATYAGLGLLCATGMILVLVSQGIGTGSSGRERLLNLVEVAIGRGWPVLLSWVVLLVALVLTHSRSGFFSTSLAMLVLLLAAACSRSAGRRLVMVLAAALAVAAIAVLVSGGEWVLLHRLEAWLVLDERTLVYARTIEAIGDAGALGTGFGTFEEAFRFYRTSDIANSFNTAHSTYLENILELGWPAAVALFAVFAGFLVSCALGVIHRRRDAVYPAVGLAATVLVAVHSAVDFSLQIPAITATYMLVMGAACAQCWSSRRPADPW